MTTAVDHGKMIFSIFFKLAGDPNSSISDEETFCFVFVRLSSQLPHSAKLHQSFHHGSFVGFWVEKWQTLKA